MRRPWLPCALILLAACSRNTSEPKLEGPEPAPSATPAAPTAEGKQAPHLPPGHVPVQPGTPVPTADAPLGPEAAGGIAFHAGEPFVRRPPGSSMRVAEYAVPDAPDAPLTVFFFPGQGGAVEANVERWIGQFKQPDGSSSKDAAQVQHTEVEGVKVTRVEVRGVYGGGMTLPGQEPKTLEDGMMLAAIAEGAEGPVFFKWVGPAKLLSDHEPAFDALIASIDP